MKIFKSIDQIEDIKHTSVALGNFDGLHRGHCELIQFAVSLAKTKGLQSVVFAFSQNNPHKAAGIAAKKIISTAQKCRLIAEMGVDCLVDIPFSEDIRRMPAEDFIDSILIGKLHAQEVSCGFNYRFGYQAAGSPQYLDLQGKNKGFAAHILPPYKIEGEVVSSTLIRKLIEQGEMKQCAQLLGRCYAMEGIVVEGNKLGKEIGFATANINIDAELVSPASGVYVTRSAFNGISLPSITNVGNKPTVGTYGKNVETHIIGIEEELYGLHFRVEFLEKLRGEIKFSGLDELKERIALDCKTAINYHHENKC